MKFMFYSGEHVYIGLDDLVHVIGHAQSQHSEWRTECLKYDDWVFRRQYRLGLAMRTTGPATCIKCMVEWVLLLEFRQRRGR